MLEIDLMPKLLYDPTLYGRRHPLSQLLFLHSQILSPICLLVWLMAIPTFAEQALTIPEIVHKHQEAISAIGNFRVSAVGEMKDTETGEFIPTESIDWVHSGKTSRFISKIYVYFDSNENLVVIESPIHHDLSYDDKEVRVLENWDPGLSIDLPLRPGGIKASTFSSIKGMLFPRVPAGVPPSSILGWFLFSPDHLHDLEHLVNAAKDVKQSTDGPNFVLELLGSNDSIRKITLSPLHGYLVSISELYDKGGLLIARGEVTDFSKTSNGAWFPATAVLGDGDGPNMRASLVDAVFDSKISEQDATVQFPHGARVEKPSEKAIYIWGANGVPEETFTEFSEFEAWEDQAARVNSPVGSFISQTLTQRSSWLFYLNATIIAIIVVLMVVRARLRASS